MNGRNSAIEIQTVSPQDRYKCSIPKFGRLKKENIHTIVGIVQEVVTTKSGNTRKGRVNFISNDSHGNGFGYIKTDGTDGDDVRFLTYLYERQYGRPVQKGQEVFFKTKRLANGREVVERFCDNTCDVSLSKEKQYCIVAEADNLSKSYRISLQEYRHVYKMEPMEGDICYLLPIDARRPHLVPREKEGEISTAYRFEPFEKEERKTIKGKIKFFNKKRHYGFVSDEKGNGYWFSEKIWKAFDNSSPQKGMPVHFESQKGPRGLTVKAFYNFQLDRGLPCQSSQFRNFVDVYDKKEIYYAYIDDRSRLKEVVHSSMDKFSEVINLYNEKQIPIEWKILATETLLELNYTNKRISREKLLHELLDLMDKAITQAKQKNNEEEALSWEIKRQKYRFDVGRLGSFSLPPYLTLIEPLQTSVQQDSPPTGHRWDLWETPVHLHISRKEEEEIKPMDLIMEEFQATENKVTKDPRWDIIDKDPSLSGVADTSVQWNLAPDS
jgi:cold shock CspA family protein